MPNRLRLIVNRLIYKYKKKKKEKGNEEIKKLLNKFME